MNLDNFKPIANMPLFCDHYLVNPDGLVYTTLKNRLLKGSLNSCQYQNYYLQLKTGGFKWCLAHRIVAFTFEIPKKHELQKEINHIDGNRLNNNVSNLEWVTHSENVLKSFREQGRNSYWKGKHKASPDVETRLLMSNAKKKRVDMFIYNEYIKTFNSVQELCDELNICSKTFNRIIQNKNKKPSQYKFKIVNDL